MIIISSNNNIELMNYELVKFISAKIANNHNNKKKKKKCCCAPNNMLHQRNYRGFLKKINIQINWSFFCIFEEEDGSRRR